MSRKLKKQCFMSTLESMK